MPVIYALVIGLLALGCSGPAKQQPTTGAVTPSPAVKPSPKLTTNSDEAAKPNHQSISAKDPAWRANMLREARRLNLNNVELFDVGVYGKYKSKVVFFADISVIPDQDRLYWVVVKVLSEKYGCLIRRKQRRGSSTVFRCADERFVKVTTGLKNRTMHFFATQYDRFGNQIDVENGEIVKPSH